MKKLYIALMFISFICMGADSTDFFAWMIWEAVWLAVFLFSAIHLVDMQDDQV